MKLNLAVILFAFFTLPAFAQISYRPVGNCLEMTEGSLGPNASFEQVLETDGSKFNILYYQFNKDSSRVDKIRQAIIELDILLSLTDRDLTDISECNIRSVKLLD
jgi:hypothetical protein